MNLAADDLLARVDQWKLKLHRKLATMSPSQRIAFWNRKLARAAELRLAVAEKSDRPKHVAKQTQRRTG